MGRSKDFLSLQYARRLFLQGVQFVNNPKATLSIRQQTKEIPHCLTDAICPEAGRGILAVTNHYIAFLNRNKKTTMLFPLIRVTEWGADSTEQGSAFWIEGTFEQGSGRFTWHTSAHEEMLETVNEQMEKGIAATERAAIARSQAKLDSYMAAVNTILNQHSEAILLEDKAAIDDKADTLLQNTQVMLDAMWEFSVEKTIPQLHEYNAAFIGQLRDHVLCYAALKGNRMAKIVLEARGYVLPSEDVFIESDDFIDEYYQAVLPPFEILEKVHEDVLALCRRILPESRLQHDPLRSLVSEAVQLGYRVTIANAMVITKMSKRIA